MMLEHVVPTKLDYIPDPVTQSGNEVSVYVPDYSRANQLLDLPFGHNSVVDIQAAIFPLDRTVHIKSIA